MEWTREAALQPFRNCDVSLPVGLFQAVVGQPQLAIFVQRTERRGPSGTEYVKILNHRVHLLEVRPPLTWPHLGVRERPNPAGHLPQT